MTQESHTRRAGLIAPFKNGNFSLLWSSTLASQLGDHLNLMALTALVFSMSEGATKGLEFSKILLLASAPVLIFGPISGVYADRVSRKKMMIISDALRAVLVAVIPLLSRSMAPIYAIVFLVFTINRFYLSAKSAAIPQIVRADRLLTANSLLNVAAMATIMLGPWGGGYLVDKFGYTVGFLADSGTYVISAVLAGFITLRSISEVEQERLAEQMARRKALGESARQA
ncbi:MAG: MFS transporter, partial [Candidatus Eisenbacteria bacterium]|nr:MFS transporter [Candidatus Eisenbacteria bacterium]